MKRSFYLVAASALLISFLFDEFLLATVLKVKFDSLITLMEFLTIFGSGYAVFVFLTLFLLFIKRKSLFCGWSSLLIALLITWILKIFIMRLRPDMALADGFSFPSGHATAVFAVYPLFGKLSKKFAYYWLGFAVLILISRLYLGVHYFSDVIGGALVGLLVGGYILNSKLFKISKP